MQMVWAAEAKKWGIPLRIEPFTKYSLSSVGPRAHIETLSRDSLHHAIPHAGRWDMIVVDEVHGFKQWKGRGKRSRMKSMKALLPKTAKRIGLTGTPTPNSLADIFSQNFILDGGEALGRNITTFRARYMRQGGWQGRQWLLREEMKQDLLNAIAPIWFRIDAEQYLDMPELLINDVYCVLPPAAQKIHKDLKRKLAAELESGDSILAMNSASAYMKLRQVSNGRVYAEDRAVVDIHEEKINALVELIDALGGEPVLLFYQFAHDLTAILKKYPKATFVNGSLNLADAQRNIDRWLDGKTSLLCIQQQAGAEGLNLQGGGCADVVFFGLSDNAALYEQGFRRVYRQGNKKLHVRVHRLLSADTVEEIQKQRLDGKLTDQLQFLDALKAWART
jgi:SNF2 family DNA or RNA helicase